MLEITIRDMLEGEEPLLWQLFHDTVHRVNKVDYDASQTSAWSPADRDQSAWAERMRRVSPFVAQISKKMGSKEMGNEETADEIVGFSDLQEDGLVDFMFVHSAYQGRGVAKALMAEIKQCADRRGIESLYAHVSITAQPFFARHGFKIVEERSVTMGDVVLTNYLMRT